MFMESRNNMTENQYKNNKKVNTKHNSNTTLNLFGPISLLIIVCVTIESVNSGKKISSLKQFVYIHLRARSAGNMDPNH